jgi:CheY-like chemotaxis protein
MTEAASTSPKPILALVADLFFILKMGDAAKSLGLPIRFAASAPEFFEQLGSTHPALIIVDLSLSGVDVAALCTRLTTDYTHAGVPILGYTTHADWKRTGALHDKCTRVVTKDTMSRSLPELMREFTKPT